jgi:ArsR family transcriptional regulator, arsenate/arsenite/antimonite-responsive transcriptional repressor
MGHGSDLRARRSSLANRRTSMQAPDVARARLELVPAPCRPTKRRKPRDIRPFAPLLKALGDETRLEIVALLADARDSLCACEIEAHFDLSQSTISHHLKLLRKAGVLRSERRGTWVYYEIDPDALVRLQGFCDRLTR